MMNLECDEDDADASEQDSPINSENLDALCEVKLEPNEMDLNSDELISNDANEGNPNDDELIINGGANLEYDQWNVNGEINSNENEVNSNAEPVHTIEELKDAIKDEIVNLLDKDNEMNSEAFVKRQCSKLEIEDKTIIPVYIDHPYSSILNADMVNHFQDVPNVNIQKMNELKDEEGHRDDIHEETLLNDQERYLDLYQEKCQYAVTHSPFNIPSFGGDYIKPWPVELANITSVVENEINIGYNGTCAESKEVITRDNKTDNNVTKIHNPSKQVPALYGSVEEVSKINGDAPVTIKRSCRVKCKRLNDQSGERKKIKCMPRQIQIFEITQRGIRCPNCTRRFKNELKLLNHFITCWTGERVKDVIKRKAASNLAQDNFAYCCNNCQMPIYLNYKRFLRHCYFCYQTNDKEELIIESIPCYKCNKFVSEDYWMKHLQKCLLPSFDEIPATRSPGGLHCHICTYKINYREKVQKGHSESNQRLASHMYHKHGIVQSGFRLLKCAEEYKKEPNCTYATVGKKYLNSHIKIKHKQDHIIGPEFQCEVLESEIKKQKLPKLTLQCEECGQMYCSKAAVEDCLEAHRRREPVPCRVPSCMKTFLTKRREKWHYKKTHDEGAAEKRRTKLVSNVPNICQACGKDFRERCRLVQHESKVHKIPLPKGYHRYQCNRCSFWDISRCIVRFHKLRHEKLGIKQYLCEVCGKKFTSFFQKEIHYRTYHKGKGYKCEHCDKLLPRKDSLILHTRIMHTHKNIKKYQCHLCEYCSNIMGNLRLHLRNKHKLTVATHSKGSILRSEQLKDAVIVTKEGSVVPYVPELLEDL
ncbi:unnamed protein product [Owenia fusiformis]|uniref:Uncharacterized protein n=1 Tax=Owenia fusiformis TaxID=6347 RepID=A0A8J1U0B8_OWEFU|nr:unnamed protein product [Owenia fusiformis]